MSYNTVAAAWIALCVTACGGRGGSTTQAADPLHDHSASGSSMREAGAGRPLSAMAGRRAAAPAAGTLAPGTDGGPDAQTIMPADDDRDAGTGTTPPACSALRARAEQDGQLVVSGLPREYVLHVPPKLPAGQPVPLVVDLHGLMTHAKYQRASSGFATLADSAGFVVAYPQAIDSAWNLAAEGCCGLDPAVDDAGFVRALVAELVESDCVDAKRVYAVGVGAGGGLAQQLACQASELFTAVLSRDFDLFEPAANSCQPKRPVAVLALRDMADPDLPYMGGEIRVANGLNARFRTLGAEASLRRWAELDRCSGEPEISADGCRIYKACASGVEVGLCHRSVNQAAQDAATAWAFLSRF